MRLIISKSNNAFNFEDRLDMKKTIIVCLDEFYQVFSNTWTKLEHSVFYFEGFKIYNNEIR